jgi:uncharacterized protein (DUF697 family)
MITQDQQNQAKKIVANYTLLAAGSGAVPVPAASMVIVAQNGIMLAHIASAFGMKITVSSISESIGTAGSLNLIGRTVFMEGARLLAWGTGSIWAASALSVLGASTAGLQTFIVGRIAIEIAKKGGQPLTKSVAKKIIDECKSTYKEYIAERKGPHSTTPA